jgi:acetyl esterase/lipase
VGLVRANAKEYGINASRIGFTGGSAGGHLTAHLSTAFAQRAYTKVRKTPCRPRNWTNFNLV